jgi:hypothetical protein
LTLTSFGFIRDDPRPSALSADASVRSVNREMIKEINFPYIDWRKPGYASLPACRLLRQACWKLKRAWYLMRVIAGDDRST